MPLRRCARRSAAAGCARPGSAGAAPRARRRPAVAAAAVRLSASCSRGSAAAVSGARQHQRDAEGIRDRPLRAQRRRIVGVVGEQQHRRVRRRASCASASSRPAPKLASTAHSAGRGLGAAVGDAPVAGGRVVHGVVKARRRDCRSRLGERHADLVAVVAIAARGAEHARQLRASRPRAPPLRRRSRARVDDAAGAPALRRRQHAPVPAARVRAAT